MTQSQVHNHQFTTDGLLTVIVSLTDWSVDGGVILIDDFGSFEGARKAFYTFIIQRGLMPLVHKYDVGD